MMNNNIIDDQIERAIKVFGCKNQSKLASILGISDTDFSNRKKRGTLLKLIEREAYRQSMNVNFILTGESAPFDIQEPTPQYGPVTPVVTALSERRVSLDRRAQPRPNNQSGSSPTCSSLSIPDLIKKTDLILKSDTQYATALKSNIEAFFDALVEKKDHDGAKKLIEDMDARLKLIEQKLLSG